MVAVAFAQPLAAGPPTVTTLAVEIVRIDVDDGRRLDNFLLARLKGVPRSRVYRMLRRGEVRVNGARAGPDYRLQRGDSIRVPPHRRDPTPPTGRPGSKLAEALRAAVIHEDENLLVLDKPSGMAVHGGSGVAFGVIEALRALVGAEVAAHCQLAHRLDRETSGCLAVAKNRRTLLELHGEFRAGQVGKRYDAIVAGRWPRGARRVEMPLARVLTTGGERRVRVRADGEPARTDFTVERWLGDGAATWLAVYPKTGRTHQIRVHAMASGHPIIGDEKYAGPDIAKKFGHPRLLLHASELAVRLRGHRHRFRAPPPAVFKTFRERLEHGG